MTDNMKPLIIALDVDTEKEALGVLKATKAHADIFKVGPPLLLRCGPDIIKIIRRFHKKVFLDLKFHDIPNTMLRSIKEAHALGVFSATVHTSAGESALKTVADLRSRPKIWGVTVLTSLQHQDLMDLGFQHSPEEQVLRLGQLAKKTGLDGVVASVGETAALRAALGNQMIIVTPGIRMPTNEVGDQKRVATPSHARQAGSNFIVVGRPIVEAKDPGLAAEEIMNDWKKGE
jgi:orotidine-5'-phosphate decarboxylase